MSPSPKHVVLLLGHGSTKHPDSSRSVRTHAKRLSERGVFSEVHCAFLKEEPRMETLLPTLQFDQIGQLDIVPDFLAEGYFTQEVIPRLLKLESLPPTVRYREPVGVHPRMCELIDQSACDVLGDWPPDEVSLLLVGHGSKKNAQSKNSLLKHIEVLKEKSSFAQIADVWLEESPWVSDWKSVATKKQIIVVPYLLSDGQHGGWDIPKALEISDQPKIYGQTHERGGMQIRLTHALGISPHFADVIESMCRG